MFSLLFHVAEKVKKEGLQVICVPTSFQAQQLITSNDLFLGTLDMHPKVANYMNTNVINNK